MITKKELREKGRKIGATVWIGKNGLTDTLVTEIKKQLKAKRIVKIKMLRASLEGTDRKALAEKMARVSESILVECVGGVVVLYKAVGPKTQSGQGK